MLPRRYYEGLTIVDVDASSNSTIGERLEQITRNYNSRAD